MDKILSILYKCYKKIRPPKRLYQYGTCSLQYFDDRNLKEKIFDWIDEYFFNWQQKVRAKRAYRKAVWNSYFSYSLGKVISSADELRQKEKQGYAITTFGEMEREADRAKKHIDEQSKIRRNKKFSEGLQRIARGTSNFEKEINNKIKSGEYEIT